MYSTRAELEQRAQSAFAFLGDKGFKATKAKRDVFSTSWFFRHARAQVGLQVLLDFRDESIDTNLVKLRDGTIPEYGYFPDRGERVKVSLDLFLRDVLHIQDERLDAVFALLRAPKPWTYRVAIALLDGYHDIVARYLDTVLGYPVDQLFPPLRK
jgi:hypothetical protein